MSRINQNIPSLIAQRVLGGQNKGLANSLQRLSTGLRINRGADDPAGLIASENLRAEKAAIGSAIKNSERADQVVNVAEGGLQEVSNMLVELQGLVGARPTKQAFRKKSAMQISSKSTRSFKRSTELRMPPASKVRSCSTVTLTTRSVVRPRRSPM